MRNLICWCPQTHQPIDLQLFADYATLARIWSSSVRFHCPHCGADHETKVGAACLQTTLALSTARKRLCVNYRRLPGCQYAGLPNAGPLGYQTIILHPCGGPAEPVGPVGPVGTCRALYGGVDRRDKFGLWRPYRIPSPASPYSLAAMKLTTFDSDCICLTILPTSSFGSLVSERRMR